MITTTTGTLAADVANGGTLVLSYPQATSLGLFTGSFGHQLVINQVTLTAPNQFSVAFGASVTITNQTGSTWKAGASYVAQLNTAGDTPAVSSGGVRPLNTFLSRPLLISLGNPVVGAANAICASQSSAALALALNGSTLGVLDVPRNVVAAWTTTAVMTVRGLDAYGKAMTESSASGTSMTGKKAFKSITSVTVSVDVTSATVGTGNVLGLPIFLPQLGNVIKELQDGAAATAGTTVAGVQTAGGSTATTGDVRGTYVPNATPDGTKSFQLMIAAPDFGYLGMPQYSA